ncbi:MAG: hypothetical protein L0Y71_18990 [Gemmataceae bacterium]|nr:hypothetical protein [Gemmataceae bacterium]
MLFMTILDTLRELLSNLGDLAYQLAALAWQHILLILWVIWWLWGVNWQRAWPVLRQGAWAPLILLMAASALVWSRIAPASCDCLAIVTIPNFWWQLGYVGMLVALMFFCGWLQGVFHWAPADVNLDPPAHGHDDHHEPHH